MSDLKSRSGLIVRPGKTVDESVRVKLAVTSG